MKNLKNVEIAFPRLTKIDDLDLLLKFDFLDRFLPRFNEYYDTLQKKNLLPNFARLKSYDIELNDPNLTYLKEFDSIKSRNLRHLTLTNQMSRFPYKEWKELLAKQQNWTSIEFRNGEQCIDSEAIPLLENLKVFKLRHFGTETRNLQSLISRNFGNLVNKPILSFSVLISVLNQNAYSPKFDIKTLLASLETMTGSLKKLDLCLTFQIE